MEYIQIDIESVAIGLIFLLAGYIFSIFFNIKLVKGEFGFLPGTVKLYSIAVIASVLCNFIDVICIKNNITNDLFYVKFILVLIVLYKIFSLKNSGDPRWVADYKDIHSEELDPGIPFSSTEGMSFCIMVAYTFPMGAAMAMIAITTIVQGLYEIKKYKFTRTLIIIILAEVEVLIASRLVQLSYGCDTLKALFLVALIGMVFNILLGVLNGKIVDKFTSNRYLKQSVDSNDM